MTRSAYHIALQWSMPCAKRTVTTPVAPFGGLNLSEQGSDRKGSGGTM